MSDDSLRLLYLAPFPPSLDGAHGGSRVIAQLIARMAERHHVALLCLRHPDEPPIDDRLRSRLAHIEEIGRADLNGSWPTRAGWSARTRLALLRGVPLWASDLDVIAFRRQLAAVLADWRPDLVQIHYTAMGVHLQEVEAAGLPTVLWDPDPATSAAIDLAHVWSKSPVLRRLDVRAWRHFERSVLNRVDAAVVFTSRDARTLADQAPATPIVTIPFGTDFTNRTFSERALDGNVLFIGNFVHSPNVDAAERLVRSIFPTVRRKHPDATLNIVGDNVPPEWAAAAGPNVVVTGRVPDAVPYLERAAVVAAPIRFGGGMRVKVVEALSAGKPLVASALAVEGLAVTDGEQFLAAESDEDFSDRIAALLADPARRARLGHQARIWARENLDWDSTIAGYEGFYSRLLTGEGLVPLTGPPDRAAT